MGAKNEDILPITVVCQIIFAKQCVKFSCTILIIQTCELLIYCLQG